MEEKRCSKCGEVKPVEEFWNNRGHKDGYAGQCKECCNRLQREHAQKNPEENKVNCRKWYYENSEKINEKKREEHQKNPEKSRKEQKEWRDKNLEKSRRWAREWRQNNLEKAKVSQKENQKKHIEGWKVYFKLKYSNPECQVCGKSLDFFTGNREISVHWDHRNGENERIKSPPVGWLWACLCNKKNISIWESCNFGILCNVCNRILPTQNRELWLEKITQYIKGI